MTLAETLAEVRRRIAACDGKDMNEQNTKAALIDPVLRALGWDVGNLEEVTQEYQRRSQDKPVDYAMLLLRMPRLFVEAKALGQSLAVSNLNRNRRDGFSRRKPRREFGSRGTRGVGC